jgi:hypothetical protein
VLSSWAAPGADHKLNSTTVIIPRIELAEKLQRRSHALRGADDKPGGIA